MSTERHIELPSMVPSAGDFENSQENQPQSKWRDYLKACENDVLWSQGEDYHGAYIVGPNADDLSKTTRYYRFRENGQPTNKWTVVQPLPHNLKLIGRVAVDNPPEGVSEHYFQADLSVRELSEAGVQEDDPDVRSIGIGPDGKKRVEYYPDKPTH
jgi:hypothetical protein